MSINVDQTLMAKTRAEEHEADVWGEFFIPPYFSQLGLRSATKSTYIIGKRGCGKTMLLKYFDYHTAFSGRRETIPPNEVDHIGIYWRVDTQFCNSLRMRGVTEDEWIAIFESYFSLYIGLEIIRALRTISVSSFDNFSPADFAECRFRSIQDFHSDFPESAEELERYLERTRRLFSTWVSNVTVAPKPLLPPGREFLEAMISDIRDREEFSRATFYIYVDEIENLVPYQRRVLNTFLKHSQKPLIVNFTSKEQSAENQTTGSEWINATHDYRLLDLDLLLWDQETIFFAEVFLGNIALAENSKSALLDIVRSPERAGERKDEAYRNSILESMRTRFPTQTSKEFAQLAVNNDAISRKLITRIDQALRARGETLTSDQFFSYSSVPEALVILPALLNRPALATETVLNSLREYAESGGGSFKSTWVHNNLVGALLELYRPYARECPLYSGFDTLCTMSNGNLRQFLILCYKSLEIAELRDEPLSPISIATQARAAYDTADQLIREIKTFGELGEQLRIFVLRLGNIFRALQASPAMSEPEQNQITINSGRRALDEWEAQFISQAVKYAILVEQSETKSKDTTRRDIVDYQLNPIYSPYFQISYRRKRKIELSVEEFHILCTGNEDEYKQLARGFARSVSEGDYVQLGLL